MPIDCTTFLRYSCNKDLQNLSIYLILCSYVTEKGSDGMKRTSCIALVLSVLLLFSGCGNSKEEHNAVSDKSYEGVQSIKYESKDDTEIDADPEVDESIECEDPVYITVTGEKYHRSNCSYLKKSKIEKSRSEAIEAGYTACSRCDP